MKKIIATLLIAACIAVTGCNTTQQTTGFNALQTIESSADAGYSAYLKLVVAGSISTNSVPDISHAYNDLHAAINAAAVVDQAGTNALLQANITTEAAALGALISTAIANK